MILTINSIMEETDEMIRKTSVEIYRFLKEYVVLSTYHTTFLSH